MVIIGIDPGVKGSIVGISDEDIVFVSNGPFRDLGATFEELRQFTLWADATPHVVIEQQRGAMCAKQSYGEFRGISSALLKLSLIRAVSEVHPRTWQAKMLGRVPAGGTKAAAYAVATDLYPGWLHFFRTARGNRRDGACDAALIATWYARHGGAH